MRAPKDLICGLLLAAFGTTYFWLSLAHGMGTAARMGPGYFPRALGALLVVLGIAIAARSFVIAGARLERFSPRPFLVIATAVALFGLLLRLAGLPVAIVVLVLVGSLAGRDWSWRQTSALAVGLAVLSTLAFPLALGLPIPIWPKL